MSHFFTHSSGQSNDIVETIRVLGAKAVRMGLLGELRSVIEFDSTAAAALLVAASCSAIAVSSARRSFAAAM